MAEASVVLTADRDPHVRKLIQAFLQPEGYIVEQASDGPTALKMVQHLRPALLIVAVMLPKLDGLALCRKIKSGEEGPNRVQVIVCSILAASVRAHEAGADAFLQKPINQQSVRKAVQSVLFK